LDLIRWGARFKDNSSRPYFEGHERPDVKLQREEFFNYFLDRKNSYFIVSDGDQPMWELPTQQPNSILICMCLKHFVLYQNPEFFIYFESMMNQPSKVAKCVRNAGSSALMHRSTARDVEGRIWSRISS
jgi:hypothetical protein